MLSVYPFGSGSLYTASFAVTASHADKVERISYVYTASNAGTVLYPQSGSRAKSVCLITGAEYLKMQISQSFNYVEVCAGACGCDNIGLYYGPTISNACVGNTTIQLFKEPCTDYIYTGNTCASAVAFTGYTRSIIPNTYNYHLNGVYQGNFVCP